MSAQHLDAIEHELVEIRRLTDSLNVAWSREHQGTRIVELGLVYIKVTTALEHVESMRKGNAWEPADQPKEMVKHEQNKQRKPQKKRPPGVFARDVAAASSVTVSARDTGTREASSPVAADRDSHHVESERSRCGISSDAAYDRAIRDCQDLGSIQRDGSGVE